MEGRMAAKRSANGVACKLAGHGRHLLTAVAHELGLAWRSSIPGGRTIGPGRYVNVHSLLFRHIFAQVGPSRFIIYTYAVFLFLLDERLNTRKSFHFLIAP